MFLWVSKGKNRWYVNEEILDFFVTLIDFNLVLLRGIMSVQYRQNKWQTRLLGLGTDIYTEIQFRGPGLYPVSLHCHYFQPNVYFRAKLATVSALNWFASLYIIGCMTILCVIYHAIHLIMIHTTMSCTTVCFTCQKKRHISITFCTYTQSFCAFLLIVFILPVTSIPTIKTICRQENAIFLPCDTTIYSHVMI